MSMNVNSLHPRGYENSNFANTPTKEAQNYHLKTNQQIYPGGNHYQGSTPTQKRPMNMPSIPLADVHQGQQISASKPNKPVFKNQALEGSENRDPLVQGYNLPDVSISHELFTQIQAQMMKLKKQNVNYRDKLKNMRIFLSESLKEQTNMERQLQEQSLAKIKSQAHRIAYKVMTSSVDQTDFSESNKLQNQFDYKQSLNKDFQSLNGPSNLTRIDDERQFDSTAQGQSQRNKERETIRELHEMLNEKEDEIARIKRSLNEKVEQFIHFKNSLQDRENELKRFRTMTELKDNEIIDLKSQINALKYNSGDKKNTDEVEKLQRLLESCNQRVEDLDALLSQKVDKISHLEREEAMKNQDLRSMSEAMAQKDSDLQHITNLLSKLMQDIDGYKDDLNQKNLKISHLNGIIDANEKDVVEFRNQIDDKERVIQSIRSELEDFRSQSNQKSDLQSRINDLNELAREQKLTLDRKQLEINKLQDIIEDLRQEVQKEQPELANLRAMNNQLKFDLENMQYNLKRQENLIQRLNEDIQEKETEFNEIALKLEESEFEDTTRNRKINSLQDIIKSQALDYQKLQEDTHGLKSLVEDLEVQNNEALKEINKKKEDLEDNQQYLNRIREQKEELESLTENLKDQIETLKLSDQTTNKQQEINNLQEKLNQKDKEVNNLTNKLTKKNTELERLKKIIDSNFAEMDILKTSLSQKQSQLHDLELISSQNSSILNNSQFDLEDTKTELETKKIKLDNAKEDIKRLQESIGLQKKIAELLQNEVDALKDQNRMSLERQSEYENMIGKKNLEIATFQTEVEKLLGQLSDAEILAQKTVDAFNKEIEIMILEKTGIEASLIEKEGMVERQKKDLEELMDQLKDANLKTQNLADELNLKSKNLDKITGDMSQLHDILNQNGENSKQLADQLKQADQANQELQAKLETANQDIQENAKIFQLKLNETILNEQENSKNFQLKLDEIILNQQQIDTLNTDVQKLTNQLEIANTQINVLNDLSSQKEQSFKEQIVALGEEIEQLKSSLDLKNKEIQDLELQLASATLKLEAFGMSNEEINSKLSKLQNENSTLSKQVQNLETQLEDLKSTSEELKSKNSGLKTSNQQISTQLEDIKNKLEDSTAELKTKIKKLALAEDQISNLNFENESQVQINEKLESELQDLRPLTGRVEILKTKLESASSDQAHLTTELENLKLKLAEKEEALNHAINSRNELLGESESLKASLNSQRGDLEEKVSLVENLEEERNLIQNKLLSVTHESECYQQQLEDIKQKILQNSSNQSQLLNDISELESKVEELQKQNVLISEQNTDYVDQINELQDQIHALNKLESDLTLANAENSNLNTTLINLERELHGMKSELDLTVMNSNTSQTQLKMQLLNMRDYIQDFKLKIKNKLIALAEDNQDSKESILFLKTYQKQLIAEQTEELGHSMKKLKMNLMQILKDVLLRWSSKIKTLHYSDSSENFQSPISKAHIDTPIKTFDLPNEISPIQFDSSRTDEQTFRNMKKGQQAGQLTSDAPDRTSELEILVFTQKEEIRRLKNAIDEAQNNSDLSVRTQDAENELKNPDKLREALNDIRKEKDRIEHQVFGLEEDKHALETDKDVLLEEIEKSENMVNNLKDHISKLDAHRIQLEDKIESLGGIHTPEQAFGIKYDYHKKLADKLDEIQQIVIAICEINGITPPDEEIEFEENVVLNGLMNYKPELPLSARENDIIVPESNDLTSIVETINSFLRFIRTRAQTVIEEYDDYHQTMIKAVEVSKLRSGDAGFIAKFNLIMEQINELNIGECVERSIYTALLNGRYFGVILKSAILKAMVELTNGVNQNMLERREELITQKKLLRTLLQSAD